jgi:hypothetical protein
MRTRLAAICQAHGIQVLFAFGSRAREALELIDGRRSALANAGADLDIGAKPSGPLGIKQKASIAVELEELFGVARVDLVVLPEADPFLAANVIRGLYVRTNMRREYVLYILRRAGDLAPLEREDSPAREAMSPRFEKDSPIQECRSLIGDFGLVPATSTAESCLRRPQSASASDGTSWLASGRCVRNTRSLPTSGVRRPDRGASYVHPGRVQERIVLLS